jgi:hypothetical protein
MLLAIGIEAPPDSSGRGRRGWLIHEVTGDNDTAYRGLYQTGGSSWHAPSLRIIGAIEVCNRIPVTASYFRERTKEPYPYDPAQ